MFIWRRRRKKSCLRETLNLLACAFSSTDTLFILFCGKKKFSQHFFSNIFFLPTFFLEIFLATHFCWPTFLVSTFFWQKIFFDNNLVWPTFFWWPKWSKKRRKNVSSQANIRRTRFNQKYPRRPEEGVLRWRRQTHTDTQTQTQTQTQTHRHRHRHTYGYWD